MGVNTKYKRGVLDRFIIFIGIFLLILQIVFATSGFTNQQGLYYTGSSSGVAQFYQDGMGINNDIGMEICGAGPVDHFVGGFYVLKVGATTHNTLITYNPSGFSLSDASNDLGGGCYDVTEGFFTVSPSSLTDPYDPDVYFAALPGKIWVGYEASGNPGPVSDFDFVDSDAQLLGSYIVPRSFDSSTRQVTIQTPTIYFQTSPTTSFSKAADDADFGVSVNRHLLMGICDGEFGLAGDNCSDGSKLTSTTFPQIFDSGLTADQVNDQNVHTKYAVLNSLGYSMCVGANLQISIDSISPDPIYFSQNLSINISISNPRDTPDELEGGNVDVTTNFDLNITIYNVSDPTDVIHSIIVPINDNLAPNDVVYKRLIWTANAHSGFYTAKITVDSGNVVSECNEADNFDTDNFELKPITIPTIYVDEINKTGQHDIFAIPNVPYNLLFHLENSDNSILNNATIIIKENNGLNLIAPTQMYNLSVDGENTTKSGVRSESKSIVTTDYYGNISFTFIPTYNKFYLSEYGYTNLDEYIGNYSLSFTGAQADGESFVFNNDGEILSDYLLGIEDVNYTGAYSHKILENEEMVSQALDFIYHTFTNFLDTII